MYGGVHGPLTLSHRWGQGRGPACRSQAKRLVRQTGVYGVTARPATPGLQAGPEVFRVPSYLGAALPTRGPVPRVCPLGPERAAAAMLRTQDKYGYLASVRGGAQRPRLVKGKRRDSYAVLRPRGQAPRRPHSAADNSVWLFQADPKIYKILDDPSRLAVDDGWPVNRYIGRVQSGDIALLWQSGKVAGVYAICQIADVPGEEEWLPGAKDWPPANADQLPEWLQRWIHHHGVPTRRWLWARLERHEFCTRRF